MDSSMLPPFPQIYKCLFVINEVNVLQILIFGGNLKISEIKARDCKFSIVKA